MHPFARLERNPSSPLCAVKEKPPFWDTWCTRWCTIIITIITIIITIKSNSLSWNQVCRLILVHIEIIPHNLLFCWMREIFQRCLPLSKWLMKSRRTKIKTPFARESFPLQDHSSELFRVIHDAKEATLNSIDKQILYFQRCCSNSCIFCFLRKTIFQQCSTYIRRILCTGTVQPSST